MMKVQTSEANDRVKSLEGFVQELEAKSADSINTLTSELNVKSERCIELQERLRRTEEALELELRQENDLPKLTNSAELIASNSNGISLSTLYSEFNHIKKQLILERSQKEKLANQLETFITELESKKPVILSYKEQIAFYESSMKDMVSKIESVRFHKLESDKKNNRLKHRIIEFEDELVGMKKLCKDLGKRLCYYLIHSKIHDGDENPLSLAEKNAIDNIMEKTGNSNDTRESDVDKLISERLVGFSSIIELQQKNAELLTITRQLSKKLEAQDTQSNNELESVAIEEAKEAIMTLEGELDSVRTKYDALTKERDVLKQLTGASNGTVATTSGTSTGTSSDIKYLNDINSDLKTRLADYEATLKKLQQESGDRIREVTTKLSAAVDERDDMKLKLNSMNHQIELIQSKYNNNQMTLQNSNNELKRLQETVEFWKNQTSKQETLLVSKSNDVKELESKVTAQASSLNSLKNENELLATLQKNLEQDISQLKADKTQLNEFVLNLQTLLKEREVSNSEISNRLAQSIANYQSLQSKLDDRDEKLSILTNQSELALKAQNAKLEQVNELSHHLMHTKNKLEEKSKLVDLLNGRIKELTDSLQKSDTHVRALQMNKDGISGSGTSGAGALNPNTNIELDQARHELQMAEVQVSELSNIAKSAEDALVNVTNSFDEFKTESDKIQTSLKEEREALNKEVGLLKDQIVSLEAELSQKDSAHLTELNQLKVELDSKVAKANSYDSLESSYEEKLQGLKNELTIYSTLADENQKKYNEELMKAESYSREVLAVNQANEQLKTTIEGLQSQLSQVKTDLEYAHSSVNDDKQRLEEELTKQINRTKDMENQNGILMNQLELLKVPVAEELGSESTGDLRQVISYIRREKESAESKNTVLHDEVTRLKTKLEANLRELEAAKLELLNSNSSVKVDYEKEHHKLLQDLEQVNILKESNTTLRNENAGYVKKIQSFEAQLQSMESKLFPLQQDITKLNETLEERNQSIRLLTEENTRLMSTATSVTSANDSEDKQKLQTLQTRFDNLLNESQTKLKAARNKEREYQKVVEQLRADVAKITTELEEARKAHQQELDNLKDSLAKELNATKELDGDIEKLKQELEQKSAAEMQKVKAQFQVEQRKIIGDYEKKLKESNKPDPEELRAQIEKEWKQKYNNLEQSIEKVKTSLKTEYEGKLQQEVAKNAQAKKENGPDESQIKEAVIKEYDSKIDQLKDEFSQQLEKEKEELKAQTEKKFEIKMRMLNKKVERLENSATKSSPSPAPVPSNSAFGFGSSAPAQPETSAAPEVKPENSESTLTVHPPENGNDKKRGASEEMLQTSNKKPKE